MSRWSLPDGRRVDRLTLTGGGLTAQLLTLGATVQDLRLDGVDHPLILGCPDPADYLGDGLYVGAIVGRFANRIGGARLALDGRDYRTDPNFRTRHTLHGGSRGTHWHLWTVRRARPDGATLTLELPDGAMGFPGTLSIRADIALRDSTLMFDIQAETDAPTPCNLAHHGYFILDDSGDVRGHRLRVAADRYLPVDDDLIPLPGTAPVAGTRFNFRHGRAIAPGGYDHNLCLPGGPAARRLVAELTGQTGIRMQIETDQPGLQLYDGAHFDGLRGLDGRRYGPFAGVALETQNWPDAPNRPDFPDSILRPGQIYRHHTAYRFAR
ncbi:galactose mutarotase [Paracoccus sediminis]|uniref:Aldose 1-epimerase n=1 Tax=Paracoccus sediminis TaxID=1214787 RepID=A0A238X8I9_9RHOB|nr:aldose epimerase family protein [Paracoccus sediminis]TBN48966.1 galactose mutarotase [Paracoccus sediminis]SNR54881.1 aldose 1-epimerase [Paracoccus sediminis]